MEKEFDTLSDYIVLAKKIISKFAPTFYGSLRQELLNNDDAIADIASAIMIGDWRWDSERKGFDGKQKSKYSYRNQCGIWAIKTYLSNKYRKCNMHYSIDHSNDKDNFGESYSKNISDNGTGDPFEIISNAEEQTYIKDTIAKILDSGIISDKQKEQIQQYYFEEKTLSEIGKNYGVTREAIRQNIQKGLSRIREYV